MVLALKGSLRHSVGQSCVILGVEGLNFMNRAPLAVHGVQLPGVLLSTEG
jgi:hypothetical protein